MISKNVVIGLGCSIDKTAYIGFKEHGGGIYIGDGVTIRHFVTIRSCTGKINIGNRVTINYGCVMHGLGNIFIGNDVILSPFVQMYAQNHGIKKGELIRSQKNVGESIVVESDVWIGANAIVLAGVKIGQGAVIGAGSIVTNSIKTYEIWAGNPAKKIGERK